MIDVDTQMVQITTSMHMKSLLTTRLEITNKVGVVIQLSHRITWVIIRSLHMTGLVMRNLIDVIMKQVRNLMSKWTGGLSIIEP